MNSINSRNTFPKVLQPVSENLRKKYVKKVRINEPPKKHIERPPAEYSNVDYQKKYFGNAGK